MYHVAERGVVPNNKGFIFYRPCNLFSTGYVPGNLLVYDKAYTWTTIVVGGGGSRL